MVDYIIVGLGLSGIAIAEELEVRGKSFLVFDNASQSSSTVAGGIFNPVILKRFTLAWKAGEQMEYALPFYEKLEQKLGRELIQKRNIYRKFHSAEEQNDWSVATDKPGLKQFLNPKIIFYKNENIKAEYGYGEVIDTGKIDTKLLLKAYSDYLKVSEKLKTEKFQYSEIEFQEGSFQYKNIKAKSIIFCEGFGMKKNPFFKYLPLQGNKGEYLLVRCPELKLDRIVKSSVFIMPEGNDIYKIGATYDNYDQSKGPTESAQVKLISEFKKFTECDFEVIGQVAGIRPTVPDRKPMIGSHPEYRNLYCCNGFGSRGVIIAPNMARELVRHIEEGKGLDAEIDLKRFAEKYYKGMQM
ncbi:FAD-binding oxidoreductase [Gramella sp. AN32]|uniref:NAD(P)/FAD-dependent oxidoreductase n=1 Tax=Christiangramia antarctica TaxID=2058158 RepID=A0ABW5X447_9FLAO|nr:FAD-binding oxidoreductase [Gramella sp. AN32]MCM4156274.1 FAD-dependent oxidoreductase [Gramella sp. AN32]